MPYPTRHRLAAGALALALALVLTGCGDDDGASSEEFCDRAQEVERQARDLEDLDVEGDVEVVKERLGEVIDAVQEMLDAAPDDLSDEADEVAEALGPLEERLAEATTTEDVRQTVADIADLVVGEGGALPGPQINERISEDC